MRRLQPTLLAWALLLLAPGLLGADEGTEESAFARERLFALADDAVSPGSPDTGGLGDIQKATARDRGTYEGQPSTTFDAIDQLVGLIATEDQPATEGLIQQGSRFYRWVTGRLVPAERDRELPPDPVPEDPPKKDGDEPDPPKKDDGDEPDPPKDDEQPVEPPKPTFDMYVFMPPFVAETDLGRVTLGPRVPEGERGLDDSQRTALLEGEIRVQTSTHGASGEVLALAGIESLVPWANLRPGRTGPYPLVTPDELASPIGVDYVEWRKVQLALRQERWGTERVTGLVTDAEVAEKKRRLDSITKHLEDLAATRASIYASLDTLDGGEREWTRKAGMLSIEIEDLKTACEDCDEAQKSELEHKLGRKNLADRRAQLELRLLYVTVLRARARLEQIETLVAISQEEQHLAETVYGRFRDAGNRGRRKRQLSGLRYQARTLDQDVAVLRGQLDSADDARKAGIENEIAMLQEMRGLTVQLIELVELRSSLDSRVAPPTLKAPTPTADAEASPESDEATLAEPDPLLSVRDPAAHEIDLGYIQLVRERLSHPDFGPSLIAEHYEAADRMATTVRSALDVCAELPEREARFETQWADVTKRMTDFPFLWKRSEELQRMQATFAETLRGIAASRERVGERLEALDVWRDELLGLGLRSFQIRVDRTLSADELGAAIQDVFHTKDRAERWVTLESEPNAADFLVEQWLGLLGAILLLVGSFFLVRALRSRIDVHLAVKARENPHLRDAITVRKEAQESREQQEAAEAARDEAEADALNKASGDADKLASEVRGEGGSA